MSSCSCDDPVEVLSPEAAVADFTGPVLGPPDPPRVLVVDDEQAIREILCDFLTMEGYLVDAVDDGEMALRELQRRRYQIVLTDLKMPNMGGLELLQAITAGGYGVLTVIMTGYGTVETALAAMKQGACDYILKPFKIEDVVRVLARGLERQRLQEENLRLREAVSLYRISEAIAQSLDIGHLLDLIVNATREEVGADLVTLMLRDGDGFTERSRSFAPEFEGVETERIGRLDVPTLLRHFGKDRPVLVHGPRALHYFTTTEAPRALESFCSVPLRVKDRVIGMLNAGSFTPGRIFTEGQRKLLSVLASRAAVSIENARLYEDLVGRNQELALANASLEENFTATLIGFAHALEEADRYTRGHSERVSFYSSLVASGLTLDEKHQQSIVQAGLMHDIGKIGIRYDKINKPGRLTSEEMAMFRTHPAKGKRILEPMRFMAELIPGAWCHHEHYDGGGYPQGLMGDRIPLVGRIVAIADTYDAMTSDRAYRRALSHEQTMHELRRCSGSQFDPELVEAFARRVEEHRAEAHHTDQPVPV